MKMKNESVYFIKSNYFFFVYKYNGMSGRTFINSALFLLIFLEKMFKYFGISSLL